MYEFLVSGLNRAAASKQAKKGRGNLYIHGCTALFQVKKILSSLFTPQPF